MVNQDSFLRRPVQPLKQSDTARHAGVTRWLALRARRIARLLLFRYQNIRHTPTPLPETDFMHVAIAGTHAMRDPGRGGGGRLLVPRDTPLIPATSGSFVLVVDG